MENKKSPGDLLCQRQKVFHKQEKKDEWRREPGGLVTSAPISPLHFFRASQFPPALVSLCGIGCWLRSGGEGKRAKGGRGKKGKGKEEGGGDRGESRRREKGVGGGRDRGEGKEGRQVVAEGGGGVYVREYGGDEVEEEGEGREKVGVKKGRVGGLGRGRAVRGEQ